MNQPTQREDQFENQPEWETPELVVVMVAAITEGGTGGSNPCDGATGS